MKSSPSRIVFAAAALGLALAATPQIARAQDHAGVIEYRQGIMQSFRAHMGGVQAALANTVPMDHASSHAIAFHEMARSLANAFPDGSMSDESRALAVIWEDRNGFMNAVSAIQVATQELVEAAESGDGEAVGTALQGVQGTCRGCHTEFRGPAN